LQWEDDRLLWRIGTGETPYYRDDRQCAVSKLEGYLPVVTQRWENQGLRYTEEAFATLLHGPLSPQDAGRSEETPSILMLRLTAENPAGSERVAHLWLGLDPEEQLAVDGNRVQALRDARGSYAKPRLRAVVDSAGGRWLAPRSNTVHLAFPVPAGGTKSVILKLPFVSDLDDKETAELAGLAYDAQRERVIAYWKGIVQPAARFSVPEPKFNDLLRAWCAHQFRRVRKGRESIGRDALDQPVSARDGRRRMAAAR
jgi:hypothetical protein